MDCIVYKVKDYQECLTFRIEGYSKFGKDAEQVELLPEFVLCGVTWQMRIYFAGSEEGVPNFWSIYMVNRGIESVMANLSVTLLHPSDSIKSRVHQFTQQTFAPNVRNGWRFFICSSDALCYITNDCFSLKVNAELGKDDDPTNSARFEFANDSGFSGESLIQSLAKGKSDPALHDTTLVVGSAQYETFPANRTILMVRSPVFHAMFSTRMQESERGEVHIPDFEAPVVRELLHFMYTDCLTQDATIPRTDLLCIATKYQVQGMMYLCEKLLIQQINTDCVVSLLQLADQQSAVRLKRACLRFIAHNEKKVTKKREFQELDQELKDAALLVIDVFKGV